MTDGPEDQRLWLKSLGIFRAAWNGSAWDVEGDVDISRSGLHSLAALPARFGVIDGYFDCSGNNLTTLDGAPQQVSKNFYCHDNGLIDIRTMEGKVGGAFYCDTNVPLLGFWKMNPKAFGSIRLTAGHLHPFPRAELLFLLQLLDRWTAGEETDIHHAQDQLIAANQIPLARLAKSEGQKGVLTVAQDNTTGCWRLPPICWTWDLQSWWDWYLQGCKIGLEAREGKVSSAPDEQLLIHDGAEQEGGGMEPHMDLLAYFFPVRPGLAEKYGIHFLQSGVKTLKDRLLVLSEGAIDETDAWAAAVVVLYFHEACHGWIEDMLRVASAFGAQPAVGHAPGEPRSLHEEALCNTAALAMLKSIAPGKKALHAAVLRFMQNQPAGYRDVDDSVCPPCSRTPDFSDY